MTVSENLCRKIEEIIKAAGEIVMKGAEKLKDSEVHTKGDANFVTEYDISVQHFLEEKLSQAVPEATFLAEEEGESENGLSSGLTFIIDPIDGTANFMYSVGHSAISVALAENGKPIFGAVYNPYTDEYFYAVKGSGAYCNSKRIFCSERTGEAAIIAFGSSPYYKKTLGKQTAKLLYDLMCNFGDIRRYGAAALDLCYVAAGRFDAFCEARLSPWDFAAGSLIVTEAGGTMSDFDGGELDYGKAGSVLASSAAVYGEMFRITRDFDK